MNREQVCIALAKRVGQVITVETAIEVVREAMAEAAVPPPGAQQGRHSGPNFVRISTGLAVMPLMLAIHRRPELWREDSYLRDYAQGPFGDVESIMLRFPEKRVFEQEAEVEAYKRGESNFDQHESRDYPPYKLLTDARPMVMNLMHFAGGERLGRVMINKIRPGGKIAAHADTPEHANYWDRFHIVLQSSPGVQFRCGTEQVYMATGEVWWFQNAIEHSVVNNSATDRIHMVVDIRTSK